MKIIFFYLVFIFFFNFDNYIVTVRERYIVAINQAVFCLWSMMRYSIECACVCVYYAAIAKSTALLCNFF